MIVCQGCGCGATHKDRPEVPADWLRSEWRRRGLPKRVQLSISGCVGPCDVPNVVVVNSETGSQWLGSITEFNQYQSLLEWAVRVHGCWASSQTTDGIQRAHDPALGVTGFDVGVGRSICLRLPLQSLELRTHRIQCSGGHLSWSLPSAPSRKTRTLHYLPG